MGGDRHLRNLITVVLVLAAALTGATGNQPVHAQSPAFVELGWVPNGSMLGTMGPFYGVVTFQNLEPIPVTLRISRGGEDRQVVMRPLRPYASITLTAEEIGVPAPGALVIANARDSNNRNTRIAGSVKFTAPVPADGGATSADHIAVDGYSAIPMINRSRRFVFPIVQTNNGWNTVVRVSATTSDGVQAGQVRLTLHPADGGTPIEFRQTVRDWETVSFDLRALGIPDGFVGSGFVDVTVGADSVRLNAIAERYKDSTNMLIINTAKSVNDCARAQSAPLVFNNYNSWNTGISIANPSDQTNEVVVTTYTMGGRVTDIATLEIAPNNMGFIYSPASGTGEGFLGAVSISGSQALCAVVDEVKYTGDQPDVGHAMSYTTTSQGARGGNSLVLPIVQRGSRATGFGDTSGVQVLNADPYESVVFALNVRSRSGETVLASIYGLGAGESVTLYTLDLALDDGFQGSLWLEPTSGRGQIIAVSNNVNYAVGYDGSSSFGLVFVP